MKIAIADDEQILLNYMMKLVEELLPEAEIDLFGSSAKLIESARKKKYDIAFLDIQMPGYSGIELAKVMKETNNSLNIIFVTGYDGYESKAMELFASGYVKKPATKEKIRIQLDNLRYPVIKKQKRVFAKTFGNFTLFVDGKPVKFSRNKTLHAVAYLVHCRGSVVSRKELSSVIFDDGIYDSNRISYISKLCSDMQSTLNELNAGNIIRITPAGLSVNVNEFDCDLYAFTDGDKNAEKKYQGEYMSQFDFGMETEGMLNSMLIK